MTATDIGELELPELEAAVQALGEPTYHARQVFRWVHRAGVAHFEQMTDLSQALRKLLVARFHVATPRILQQQRSEDGTVKFLLELHDGHRIESVFIPDTPHQAFCLSTQVGCAMHCAFCLTGKMGLTRNLSAGEIVGQVRVLAKTLDLTAQRFNIVFMGMGEPLHNYDATMKALRILTSPSGLAIPPRRMTLSTVGVPNRLEQLARELIMPNLAVSLHAANEEARAALVPVNRRYGLADILAACRQFPVGRRRRITFEYVLLAGVNDSTDDARQLATLLTDLKSKTKVNLIPLNEAPAIPFDRPTDSVIDRFARTLADHGVTVSVRKSRGRDIRAACGQLIVGGSELSDGQRLARRLGH